MSDALPTKPSLVTISINGKEIQAKPGTILVEAAAQAGIEIPIFCYEPRLGPPIGACRMCLVEVEGMRGLQTACSTPVAPDMVVHTNNEAAATAQDGVLELLLANHPLDCPVCDKGGECPLQDRTFKFGPGETRFVEPKRHFPKPLDLSTEVAIDRERCIACFRCIRFSQDVSEDGQLGFQERGAGTEVATFSGEPYESRFSGNIIDLCPVGALTSIPYRFVSRPWDVQNAPSVCGLCPVGCNTELTMREGETKRTTGRPNPNMTVEEGWLCDKGRWGYPAAWSADRILRPLVRDANGTMVETSLEAAVDAAARLIAAASATQILVGAASTVEDGFLAQELAAVLPNAAASRLGFPDSADLEPLRALPRAELSDIDTAGAVAVVGGDVTNRHPIVELRLRKLVRNRGALAMVGPRTSPLDARATFGARTAPGQLSSGLAVLAAALEGASAPLIIWDEADLANEPAAAAELARIATAAGARQIELAVDVNGRGLRALGLPCQTAPVAAGALVAVNADPLESPGAMAWADAIDGVGAIIAVATHRSAITERADVVLPTLMHHEVEGVLVSTTGRAQRLRPGSRGPREAAAAWELLIALSHRTGTPLPFRTPAQAFAAVAAARPPFAGLSYSVVGDEGAPTTHVAQSSAPQRSTDAVGDGIALVVTTEIFGDAVSWRSDALVSRRTPAHLVLAPQQAATLGLVQDQRARVSSPFGTCILPVVVDAQAPEGAAFVAMGPPASGTAALLAGEQVPVNVMIEVAE